MEWPGRICFANRYIFLKARKYALLWSDDDHGGSIDNNVSADGRINGEGDCEEVVMVTAVEEAVIRVAANVLSAVVRIYTYLHSIFHELL